MQPILHVRDNLTPGPRRPHGPRWAPVGPGGPRWAPFGPVGYQRPDASRLTQSLLNLSKSALGSI